MLNCIENVKKPVAFYSGLVYYKVVYASSIWHKTQKLLKTL